MKPFASLSVMFAIAIAAVARADAPLLIAQPATPMERTNGWFDYLVVDQQLNRLLLAHAGNDELAIVDLKNGALLKRVSTGPSRGVAVDSQDAKYFVGTVDNAVAVVDSRSMTLKDKIALPGPVDAIAYDPKNHTLYADEDGGSVVWAIDGRSEKVTATIAIPNDPEYVVYDPVTDRMYQNIVSTSSVAVINPQTNAIVATWPLAPATRPHGLAVDGARHRLYSAGANGKLAVLDTRSGAVLASTDIAPRVDQIDLDPITARVFCASGTGVLSVVQETDAGATALGNVVVPRGTHTLAVDPKTHAVWIAYGGAQTDFVMKLTPP